MGFNEINHKIDMKVKKDYQAIISPLLQSMLGFRQAIFRGGVCFRLGSGPQERIKFSVRVLSLGGTENGGRCPSTVIGNRTGGRRDGEIITRVFDPIQYCPLLQRRFQTMEIDIRDDTGSTVPFERGRVVVTFYCRKRKEFSLE